MHRAQSILRDDPDPNEPAFYDRIMAAVGELARFGYRFALESEEESIDSLSLHWEEADELASISLVKDLDTGVCSVSVVAPRASDVRRITEVTGEKLDYVALSELHERARTTLSREPTLLIKIALAAGAQPDPETVNILQRALEHRFPNVRFYAAWAMGITAWPLFAPDLEKLLKLEPDDDVEDMAERALAGCQREGRLAASRR